MLNEINEKIREASSTKDKSAMFHYQVLSNAKKLSGIEAVEFCVAVGVPKSYAIEFKKMLKLARIIN